MSNLVQVPWQKQYWLTPDTLALLVAASNRLGTQLMLNDAWRSYAEQAYYYDQYLHHGGPVASNPDTGQRNHMRGGAFDLIRTDAAAQAACRAVGLTRDPAESWHWNNPNWPNMPIIPTNDGAGVAGGGAVPINNTTLKGRTMYLEWDTGGTGWLVLEPAWIGLPSMQIYNLFKRVINSNQAAGQPDTFLRIEVDMMVGIQQAVYRGMLAGGISIPTLDTTKLADAVATALSAKGIPANVNAADPNLAKALDAGFLRSMTAYANAAATSTTGMIGFDTTKLANAVAQSLQKTGIVTSVDTQAVQDAVSAAISRATAAIAKATATANATA